MFIVRADRGAAACRCRVAGTHPVARLRSVYPTTRPPPTAHAGAQRSHNRTCATTSGALTQCDVMHLEVWAFGPGFECTMSMTMLAGGPARLTPGVAAQLSVLPRAVARSFCRLWPRIAYALRCVLYRSAITLHPAEAYCKRLGVLSLPVHMRHIIREVDG